MLGLIIGILSLIGAIILGIYFAMDQEPGSSAASFVVGFVVAFVSILLGCITSIPTGHTGVITTFGRVESTTLEAGIHGKAPWQSIIKMDNRVQKATVTLSCFSSDIQEVEIIYTLNYQINKANAQEIYKTVGTDYYQTVIEPNIAESVKMVVAKHTAENLIGSRDILASDIEAVLTDQLERYNIELVSTAVEDMDFTDEFTAAVEAKQVAVQNKLKAQTEQEQKTMEAQQAAERAEIEANAAATVAKIAAQADLEVTKIQADAAEYAGQKEAAKNKAISEWLTDDLINYYYIQQWNGILPDTYMGSENVSTIVGIGE